MRLSNDYTDSQNRATRGWQLPLILLFVSTIILGMMMLVGADFDYSNLRSLFTSLGLVQICGLLLLSCLNFFLRALRWHWFTRRLGLDVPMANSVVYYLAGFSMGVTPGRMGELIRLWMIRRRYGVSYHRAMPLLIGDRINDLLVIVVLALSAGVMIDKAPQMIVLVVLSLVLAVNLVLRHPRCLIAVVDVLYGLTRRWRRVFAAARRTLRTGREVFSVANAAIASVLSIVAWFAECLAFYLLLSALGTNIPIDMATFIYSFATLVGALSFLPGGLGGFEATAVVLLKASGVDLGTAVFATSVIRLTTLWFSVALGSLLLSYVLLEKRPADGQG
jgi:uncharacterized protein (TIRG00374 family)